jgi:Arc/MetJ family transcription regulator
VIFKQVGEGRPYPDHARSTREWAEVPPRPVRLDQLITTKAVLDLRLLLSKDSTFYGDLFPHVIQWRGELYLEDGLHRALGAALHQRSVLHARVLDLDAAPPPRAQPSRAQSSRAPSPRAHSPRHSRRRADWGPGIPD